MSEDVAPETRLDSLEVAVLQLQTDCKTMLAELREVQADVKRLLECYKDLTVE